MLNTFLPDILYALWIPGHPHILQRPQNQSPACHHSKHQDSEALGLTSSPLKPQTRPPQLPSH